MSDYFNPCEDKYKCEKKEKKLDCCNVHVTVNCGSDDKSWKCDGGKHGEDCQVFIVINCDKEDKKDKCLP